MRDARRMQLDTAERIAGYLAAVLSPVCERIAIGGSIRRRRPLVKDIEIVAIPVIRRAQADLFGDVWNETDTLDEWVRDLIEAGTLAPRLDVNGRPRLGLKTKLLLYQGVAVDLFTATPDNWGWIFMLRTGPGAFNTRNVTRQHAGGKVMPFGMRSEDGYLWRGNTRLVTPEETDAFAALGLPWIEPEDRR